MTQRFAASSDTRNAMITSADARKRASPVYRGLLSALNAVATPLLPELLALIADYTTVYEHEWDATRLSASVKVSGVDGRLLAMQSGNSQWCGAFGRLPLRSGALSWLIRFHEKADGGCIGVALPGVALVAPSLYATSYGAWCMYSNRGLYTYAEPVGTDGKPSPPDTAAAATQAVPLAHAHGLPPAGLFVGTVTAVPAVTTSAAVSATATADAPPATSWAPTSSAVLDRLHQRLWTAKDGDARRSPHHLSRGAVVRVDCDLHACTVSYAVTRWYDVDLKKPLLALPPFEALGVAYHIPELADCVPYIGVSDESYAILPVTTPDSELLNPALPMAASDQTESGERLGGALTAIEAQVRASASYRALALALTALTTLLPELQALVADYATVLEHEWDANRSAKSLEVSATAMRVVRVKPYSGWCGTFSRYPLRCGALSWLIRVHENASSGTVGVALPGVALTDPPLFGTSYGAWGMYTDRCLYTLAEPAGPLVPSAATGVAAGDAATFSALPLANPNGVLPAALLPAAAAAGAAVSGAAAAVTTSWTVLVGDVSERLRQRLWIRPDVTPAQVRMGCGTVMRVDCDSEACTVSYAVTHWYDPKTKKPFAALPPFTPLGVAYHIPELADCVPYIGVSDGSYAILPVTTPAHELLDSALYEFAPSAASPAPVLRAAGTK